MKSQSPFYDIYWSAAFAVISTMTVTLAELPRVISYYITNELKLYVQSKLHNNINKL